MTKYLNWGSLNKLKFLHNNIREMLEFSYGKRLLIKAIYDTLPYALGRDLEK